MQKTDLRIVVGSLNPVKISAARKVLEALYPDCMLECEGLHAPSGVADQPMSANETRQGAINRVKFCQQTTTADYYIAMEGGVDVLEDGPATFAYVVIAKESEISVGRSAMLPLPTKVYDALLQGEELGDVMDALFNTQNIKQKGGAIALLTNGLASREGTYSQALTLAFAPFLHKTLYKKTTSANCSIA